jgi:hypothetical protein
LAIVFRRSRSTAANKEQCPPIYEKKKTSQTKHGYHGSESKLDAVACAVPSAFNSDFLACEEAAGNLFFVTPLRLNARSRRRVGRGAQRLRRPGRAAAAARSTGLRPIHFIHFIAATVTNRGTNLLEGIGNHYKIVMFGKGEFCWQPLHIRFARFEIVSTRGL